METAEFLRRHFADLRDDEVIEIRCVFEPKGERPVVQKYFDNPDKAAAFALKTNALGYHAYYGANPRSKTAIADGRKGKDAVARVTHLWVDVDDLQLDPKVLINDLPLPETMIQSGGGYQILWRMDGDDPDWPKAELTNRCLAQALGGDAHAVDLARILRLPETINHKPEYPPGTTAFVAEHYDTAHDFAAFAHLAPKMPEPAYTIATPRDTPVDAYEFYDALAHIDPLSLSYDEWLRVLMAIHAFDPSTEGLLYAETWGQGKPGEITQKWRGFKREGSNPETVFYFARQAGWAPTRASATGPGLLHDTPASRKSPRPGPSITLTPIADFFTERDSGPRWLVDHLLNAGGTSLLVAKQKVGKSTFAANLAVAVGGGQPFLGRAARQGLVHVYSLEVHRAFVRQQYQTLVGAYGLKAPPEIKIHAATGIVAGCFDQIAEAVLRERPSLVILDTLAKAVDTLKDGNDYLEVYRALQPVIALAEESGAHIVCVHHANKGLAEGADAVMGSVGFAASVDLTMLLRRDREANIRTLELEARFLPETDPVAFDFDDDRKLVLLGQKDRVLRETAEARILSTVAAVPGLTATEIKQATGLPDGIAGPAIHKLTQVMRLRAEGSPKRYEIVQYAPPGSPPGFTQAAYGGQEDES